MPIPGTPLLRWRLAGLAIIVAAAWFSKGYHHPDEHFQVLEFCNYKRGLSPLSDLPWEYSAHCRSALLPSIAIAVCNTLNAAGLYNPFVVTFLLRLLMGLTKWLLAGKLIRVLFPNPASRGTRKLFLFCITLLWFVPYLAVRFSAENASCILLFSAIILIYPGSVGSRRSKALKSICAGICLALALFIRLQIGFALIGLAIWMIFVAKLARTQIALIFSGCLAGTAVALQADRCFYGLWTVTPFEYFKISILQHKAANWGTTPWWDYFWMFFQMAVPPISIILLAGFLTGIIKKPKNLFSLMCITMIAGHMLIGHKEMRFLYPIYPAFLFVFCTGISHIIPFCHPQKWYKPAVILLVVTNLSALVYRIFAPAQEAIGYYKYIYYYADAHPSTLLLAYSSPYNMPGNANLEMNFYKPSNLKIDVIKSGDEIAKCSSYADSAGCLILDNYFSTEQAPDVCRLNLLYCQFPRWLLQCNFSNWQQRSNIWAVYSINAAGTR